VLGKRPDLTVHELKRDHTAHELTLDELKRDHTAHELTVTLQCAGNRRIAVNSDLLVPEDGAVVEAGPVEARGYAFAGGRREVERVDVSLDGGRTWVQAELDEDLGEWAWRLWRVTLELEPGEHEITVRAWDSATGTQPEDPAGSWNPKGYANNAWGRVRVAAR
jgi:sulfite oxidase